LNIIEQSWFVAIHLEAARRVLFENTSYANKIDVMSMEISFWKCLSTIYTREFVWALVDTTHVITKRNLNADRCVFVANASVLTRFGREESSTRRQTHLLMYLLERVWESLIGTQVFSAVTAFARIQIILFKRNRTHPEFLSRVNHTRLLRPSAGHGHAGERVHQHHSLGAGIYRSAFLCVPSSKRSQMLVDLIHLLLEW
jgi:hypothetical protein